MKEVLCGMNIISHSQVHADESSTQYTVKLDKIIIYIDNCISTKSPCITEEASISFYNDLIEISKRGWW